MEQWHEIDSKTGEVELIVADNVALHHGYITLQSLLSKSHILLVRSSFVKMDCWHSLPPAFISNHQLLK